MEVEKALSPAAAEARRAYIRKWKSENKDKVAASQRRYWEKKAAEAAAGSQEKN